MNIFAAKLNRFGLSITQGRKIIQHETTLSVWIVRDLYIEYLVITKTFGGIDFEHVAPYPVSCPSLIMKVTIFVRGDSWLSFYTYLMKMVTQNTSLKKKIIKTSLIQ